MMEELNLNEISESLDDEMIDNEDRKKPLSIIKLAKILIFFLIFVLLITLLMTYGEQINIDNLKRVAAKVNYSFNPQLAPDGTLSFANDHNNRFDKYKDGICVLSSDGIRVYDDKGYLLNWHEISIVEPALDVSPRYILAYGLGSDRLYVVNSYRTVFTGEYEEKIIHASLGWSNCLAVTTYASQYNNAVKIYDRSFNELYTLYHSENYIIGAEVAPDGNHVAVAGTRPDGADYKSVVMVYDAENDDPVWTFEIKNELIREVSYKKNGNLYVLTDRGIRFIDPAGKLLKNIELAGTDIIDCDKNDAENTAFLMDGEGDSRNLIVLDSRGETVRDLEISSDEVLSLSLTKNTVMILSQQNMTEIYLSGDKTNETLPLDESYNKIIRTEDSVFLIKGNRADVRQR